MRNKKSKTHVFPYTALEPFVTVTSSGDLEVKPYIGELRPDIRENVSKLNSQPNDERLFNMILQELGILRVKLEDIARSYLPNPPPIDIVELVGEKVRREIIQALREITPLSPEIEEYIKKISNVEDLMATMKTNISSIRQTVKLIEENGNRSEDKINKLERLLTTMNISPNTGLDEIITRLDTMDKSGGEFRNIILENILDSKKTGANFKDVFGEMRETIVQHDKIVASRFDYVIDQINKLNLNAYFQDRLNDILRGGEVTRSELSDSTTAISKLLSEVANKSDIEGLMLVKSDITAMKDAMEKININPNISQIQRNIVEETNTVVKGLENRLSKLFVYDDVISSVNRHSSEEVERVVGGSSREISGYIGELKESMGRVQETVSKYPDDFKDILRAISKITQTIGLKEADRKRLNDLTNELTRVREDMDKMINILFDRLSQHHETQTEVVLNKLKEGHDILSEKMSSAGEYGSRVDEIISRIGTMENYLRNMSNGTKLDELDDAVERCERLEKMNKSIDEIFETLQVKDINKAKDKIQDLLKISQEKNKGVVVYTSSPNLREVLKYDEEGISDYRRGETDRFVKLGIQVFDLRTRFTKLIHGSVFLRDHLAILSKLPREYDSGSEPDTILGDQAADVVVLQDAFSPVYPPTDDINEMIIASIFQRTIHHEKVLGLLIPSKKSVVSELLQILKRRGRAVGNGYHIYGIDEMFDVTFSLINNAREFVRTAQSKDKIVSGTPVRYSLVNAFVDAIVESVTNAKALDDAHGNVDSQIKLPNNAISYVKIRADDGNVDKRFSIILDNKAEKILLGHEPYVVDTMSVGALKNYYQHDVYGPHTRIFTHKQNIDDMASNMREVISEIDNGKDVMMITLGPAGSGKTSTILYFRDEKIPGILPRLLSQISNTKYTQASLVAYELTANYNSDRKMYWSHYEVFDSPIVLSRDSLREWRVANTSDKNVIDYSSEGVCTANDPYTRVDRKNIRVESGKTVGDLAADIVDMRLNCGTKNNQFSSRSHLFIIIKINSGPNIIIGDLAGRENPFDCDNYDTLFNLASNKIYYPDLYRELTDVDEIIKLTSIRPKTASDIYPETVDDFASAIQMAKYLNFAGGFEYPSKTGGYFLLNMNKLSKESFMDMKFYSGFSKLILYFGDFIGDLKKRLENIDGELPPLRMRLEPLVKHKSRIGIIGALLNFFRDKFSNPILNFHVEDFFGRFKKYTDTTMENFLTAFKLVPRVIEYLLTVKLIEERVMNGRSKEACRVRNLEGTFINRSLDEITEFARMLVLSREGSQVPPIHESCLPISCGFAGMDCLIPKSNLRMDTKSALMDMFDKVNIKIDPGNTSLCMITVLNFTVPGVKVPHVYRPTEDIFEKIYASYLEKERSRDIYFDDFHHLDFDIISDKIKSIINIMKTEEKTRESYRTRREYTGASEYYILKDSDIQTLYKRSFSNWNDIRVLGDEILEMMSNMYHNNPNLDSIMENTVKPLIRKYKTMNAETNPGTLRTCEYILKASDHLPCSVTDVRDILRDNDTWKTRPLTLP